MSRPEVGRACGKVRGEGLDTDSQLVEESPDDADGLDPGTPGIDEHLGVRAGRQDQLLPAHATDGVDRCPVMGVLGVQERDDDARVEDAYRHSLRSFRRAPLG